MIRPGAVRAFTRKAQESKGPGGLYGIFGDDTDTLWFYLEDYAETCDDVMFNTAQLEVTFANGARVRVFCAAWRTYYGLTFEDVLIADDSIRAHVYGQIIAKHGKGAAPDETPPVPVFGL